MTPPENERKKAVRSVRGYLPDTELVQGGTIRSEFSETSEALFLNSGYVYESAEQAEARFKGEDEGYI